MKKVLIITIAISLIVAGIAFATVVSTKHDMRSNVTMAGRTITAAGSQTTQVCVFCHHPHRGSSTTISSVLLWNVSNPAETYATYAGSSSTNSTGLGGNLTAGVNSVVCMSCHDGGGTAIAFIRAAADGALGTVTGLALAIGNLGSTLEEDHPVDFTYPTSVGPNDDILEAIGQEVTGASTTVYPLYAGTMQCATCHDVHNGQSPAVQFMRGGTTNIIRNSVICVDCHTKK